MKKWIKEQKVNLILCLIILIGIGLISYPSVADWWNSFHQSRAIASYAAAVSQLNTEDYDKLFEEAEDYNRKLSMTGIKWSLTEEEIQEYNSILDISGHRGLPSARLFTDLDRLTAGDIWTMTILNRTVTYEVDQIRIVEPEDLSELKIVEGEDYCTLLTCTPYGINSHRLLVRGHRIPNLDGDANVTADAMQVDKTLVAIVVAAIMLLILLIHFVVTSSKWYRNRMESREKKRRKNKRRKNVSQKNR